MNIIKTNTETKSVTVELSWDQLDHFISEYDKVAGRHLRHNNLEMAMFWVKLSKELQETRTELVGK
jgi:hypothetical protein